MGAVRLAGAKLLWSGGWYMTANHIAHLAEPVSAQPNGIVLAWSAYSGDVQNYDWVYQFIPKGHVGGHAGAGVSHIMVNSSGAKVGRKYVYVADAKITGSDQNNATSAASGITWANNYWVLREVWGL